MREAPLSFSAGFENTHVLNTEMLEICADYLSMISNYNFVGCNVSDSRSREKIS